MAGAYVYLIASLPMLHFGAKPPFSFSKFLELCQGLISSEDRALLENSQSLERIICRSSGAQTFRLWQSFEKRLRNELVKVRAHHKHIDPAPYLREGEPGDISLSHIAQAARKMPSLLSAEEFLDKERWQKLEDLTIGHYFDMDFMVTYAQKLLILERWERIRAADKSKLLEEVLQKN